MPSNLQITSKPKGDALLISIKGDAGMASMDVLERELSQICERKPALAVLDMTGLSFISSMGMGSLVTFQRGVQNCGGKVKIAGLQPLLAEAFRRARLSDVFEIHESVEGAIGTPSKKTKAKKSRHP